MSLFRKFGRWFSSLDLSIVQNVFEIYLIICIHELFSKSVQVSEFDVKPWVNGPSMTSDIAKSEKRISS